MQMKYWLVSLALAAQWAIADDKSEYSYGQLLDVAKVISIEAPQGCDIGQGTMIYEDSQGETHTVTYLRQGESCSY